MLNIELWESTLHIKTLTRKKMVVFINIMFFLLGFNNIYAQQLRIMPLGNSITHGEHGSNPYGGFRDDLAYLLLSENIDFDFVGTLNDNTLYPWHEGHPGKQTAYLERNVYDWVNQTYPDIVLLHIGTNDITGEVGINTIKNNIEKILNNIWSYNPAIPILLCSVIPRKDSSEKNHNNSSLCKLIHQLAIDKLEQGKPIRYVGQNEVWLSNPNWTNAYLYDDFHPNNAGYSLMGEIYFNVLMNQITGTSQFITDNFDRSAIGYTWENESVYIIEDNEMTIDSGGDYWYKPALYIAEMDPVAVSFTWGVDVDSSKEGNAGLALLMDDDNISRADGYLVYKESETGKLRLFLITDGAVASEAIDEVEGFQGTPYNDDEVKVAFYRDESGHHFYCFVNNCFDGELTDPDKLEGKFYDDFAGVMLAGNDNNSIDNFKLIHIIGEAENMFIMAGNDQRGIVNTTLADSLVVGVTDVNGHPFENIAVTFTVTEGDATIEDFNIYSEKETGNSASIDAVQNSRTVLTNSGGKAFVKIKLGLTPGPVEITASSTELAAVVVLHASITSGEPSNLTISNGNPQTGFTGEKLSLPFEVLVTDEDQNPVHNASVFYEIVEGEEAYLVEEQPVSTDADGNAAAFLVLGPAEGLYRVQASIPEFSITPVVFEATAIPLAYSISGNIVYFSNNEPVNNVMLNVTGDQSFVDSSNIDGSYFVELLPPGSNVKLTPRKAANDNNDELITIHNAALIMQHVIKLDTLEGNYLKSADVDKNENVQAYDASLIAHYAVGLPKGSDSYVGEWIFYPPYHQYFNIQVNYDNRNFTALLLGDIEGKWNQSYGLTKELTRSLYPRLDNITIQCNETFTIPLKIEENTNMISCFTIFKYDPELLSCININKTELTDNFTLIYNEEAGVLKAGLYSAEEINDAGVVLEFTFLTNGAIDQETDILLEKFQINNEIVQQTTAVVSLQPPKTVPSEFGLLQNFPNPFNPVTTIPYKLAEAGNVQISVYNLLGQKIVTLFEGYQKSGLHEFKWKGKDRFGNNVAGGVFICEVKFNNQRKIIKMVKLQ